MGVVEFHLISVSLATVILVGIYAVFTRHPKTPRSLWFVQAPSQLNSHTKTSEPNLLVESLVQALPESVILPNDTTAFVRAINYYWAQQECEATPACIFQPRSVQELCTAIRVLSREYETGRKQKALFAVRGGGHSPISGAASLEDGVVIDMSLFCDVTPSEDGSSVIIEAGAKWKHVSNVLDKKDLAVAGGRDSAVGVAGLTLGGGLSYFSSRFGFVCSNVVSYEVVLASGSVVTASESTNSDLWRALKGGSNNFGIVTRFTARSFPSTKVWGGFLFLPAFQAEKTLAAFHGFVSRTSTDKIGIKYDDRASGPITCFTYFHKTGAQLISINLMYTGTPENMKQWPTCWNNSSFKSLWRYWSTCKLRTLTSVTDEMDVLNPPGRRQAFATTTIMNDPATLTAVHAAWSDAIASIRCVNVKEASWSLALQPLLSEWACKGNPNPLGLDKHTGEPLVIVFFAVKWVNSQDDDFMQALTRRTIERIDNFATANKTAHRYRYLNYCARWQKPFEGYGEENLRFLQSVSKTYDPKGLFQRGCAGGFKLDMTYDKA